MKLTKKSIAITLLCLSALLILGTVAYRYFGATTREEGTAIQVDNDKKKDSAQNSEAEKQKALDNMPSGIKKIEGNRTVEPLMKVPEGWTQFSDKDLMVKMSFPGKLKAQTFSPKPLPGDKSAGYANVIFFDSKGVQNKCCILTVSDKSFADAISYIESEDTGDDGKITAAPGRIWTDVVDKGIIQYRGLTGIKYTRTKRISTKPDKTTSITYVLSGKSKTYEYVIAKDPAVTFEESENIFRTLEIQ